MNNGWIKLYRTLTEDCLWLQGTPVQKNLMIVLLLSSNSTPYEGIFKGEKIIIKRGQLLTSLESLKLKIGKGATIQKIRTALKNLVKYGFITENTTEVGRLIAVVNYSKYQDGNIISNKPINRQVPKLKHSISKALTPNNKDNKENKENNKRKEVIHYDTNSRNYSERKYTQEGIQKQINSFYAEEV